MSQERSQSGEDRASSLGLLVRLVLAIGLILLAISVVGHILHLLFLVAVIWVVGFVAVGAYRLGRRRGP
jgi:hypothetical protein